ncbi:hypothetical protein [Spiroplasma cantharicola]|uniref:Transmembrane protein n=1 Tax=Spiroplasma cantharicola TaxID=362837 RepID=A0A0M4K0S0_9MOLU|nr:hypothetical protein [Spiroplasma cantharicola]ALD66087.1 hypothetical protein SCANT_v1c01770 [Spiroplasma cantharicola]
MKKIKIWKIIIMLLVSISIILILPWITVDINNKIVFSSSGFNIIRVGLLATGLVYVAISLFSILGKKRVEKIFGVFDIIFSFWVIIILSMHTFLYFNIEIQLKMTYFMPLLSLLIVDLIITIVDISINYENISFKNSIQRTNSIANKINDENYANQDSLKDVSDLKNKILNMKSGLNKSYEEAIHEIERTGALNGLDMSSLIKEDEQESKKDKIIPFSVEENQQILNDIENSFKQQENQQSESNNNLINEWKKIDEELELPLSFDDPIANSQSDKNYQDIDSSTLETSEIRFTSRRTNTDENKH